MLKPDPKSTLSNVGTPLAHEITARDKPDSDDAVRNLCELDPGFAPSDYVAAE